MTSFELEKTFTKITNAPALVKQKTAWNTKAPAAFSKSLQLLLGSGYANPDQAS
jgi:hypothetical protein